MTMQDLGLRLNELAKSGAIKTHIFKLPMMTIGGERDLAVRFEGLSRDEVETLIACMLKIEMARPGAEVLTPTEYRGRFSGLDI